MSKTGSTKKPPRYFVFYFIFILRYKTPTSRCCKLVAVDKITPIYISYHDHAKAIFCMNNYNGHFYFFEIIQFILSSNHVVEIFNRLLIYGGHFILVYFEFSIGM